MDKLIIYPCLIALVFAELSGIVQTFSRWLCRYNIYYKRVMINGNIKKIPSKLKPFGCGKCLAFWLTGISCFYHRIDPFETIAYMCISFICVMFAKLIYDSINING